MPELYPPYGPRLAWEETGSESPKPMKKFALQYFKSIGNKPAWLKGMVEIGPQLTVDPHEALEFNSREEAAQHPAWNHPVCLLSVVPSPVPLFPVKRVEWERITDNPLQCGDVWASHDPNWMYQQGSESYNLQMQAVHPDAWGISPSENNPLVNANSGGYWRPLQILEYAQDKRIVKAANK